MSEQNAKDFLAELFQALGQLDDIVGDDLTVEKIIKAAKKLGHDFSEEELRQALIQLLSEREVPLARFSFSESPSG